MKWQPGPAADHRCERSFGNPQFCCLPILSSE